MTDTTEANETTEEWALVELMGHRSLAGRVTEVQRFGATLMRIDIPGESDAFTTQFYGGQAIYCVTPTTEELARKAASRLLPRPTHPLLPPAQRSLYDDEDDWGDAT